MQEIACLVLHAARNATMPLDKPNHQVTKLQGLSNSWCRHSWGGILSLW
jgi:hypothetical protein